MNRKTQGAWLEYMRSQADNPKFLIAKDFDSGIVQDIEKPVRDGFDAGYAAATADTERLVRKAVEATIEEAAQVAIKKGIGNGHMETCGWIAAHVRGINVDAIVQRVMGKEAKQ